MLCGHVEVMSFSAARGLNFYMKYIYVRTFETHWRLEKETILENNSTA